MKKFFVLISFLAMSLTMSAQETNENANESGFQPHMYVGIGLGTSMYFGESDAKQSFGKRQGFDINAYAGYQFSRIFGAKLRFETAQQNGATSKNGPHAKSEVVEKGVYKQQFRWMNLEANLTIDVLELIRPMASSTSKFGLQAYGGLGFFAVTDTPKRSSASIDLGLMASYKITDNIAINLDAHHAFVNEHVDGEWGGRKPEGPLSIALGASYHF